MLEEPGAEVVDEEPSIPDETQGLVNNPTYVDDDDHWQDVVQHRYSGIHDIIVTGTVRLEFSSLPFDAGSLYLSVPDPWA